MRALFFVTDTDCQSGLDMINANIRVLAVNAGYTLDEDGNVIGKDASGTDQPAAQPTTTWDVPKDVGEGTVTVDDGEKTGLKWWICDPSLRYGDDILNGVVDGTKGDYQYPPDPEEA